MSAKVGRTRRRMRTAVGVRACRAVIIVNPRGNGGRAGRRWTRDRAAVIDRMEARFSEVDERVTGGANEAERITRESLRGGVDVVFAVGGDGTLNEVVNGFFSEDKSDVLVRRGILTVVIAGSRLAKGQKKGR